jgi:bifunctional DNase/RNase
MEGEMDREQRSKEKYPIMMDQEEIQEIMQKAGRTRSGRPYQYELNRNKKEVVKREGLESDEEEVEDIHVRKHIEETLHATYEINTRGAGYNEKEGTPIQIRINVEPTTPCMINKSTKKELFR